MRKSMMRKTTIREIKQSLGRYLAILAIVALGVGFFAGLRVTKPSMVNTAQEFLHDHQFFDYRLVSTLGFEDTDVGTIAGLDQVAAAEGTITKDFLANVQEGDEKVFIALSVPGQVNKTEVTEGRMPESSTECVIDTRYEDVSVGDRIEVAKDNEQDTLDMFAERVFTVVGKVKSPLYVNFERGSTGLLDGKVTSFAYFPMEAFDTEYYTDIYLTYDRADALYSEAYDRFMEEQEDKVTDAAEGCLQRRYDSIVNEAQSKIDEEKAKVADHQKELDDGKNKLDDANRQLADAGQQLEDAKQKLDDAKIKLEDGQTQLDDGKKKIANGKKQIADVKRELTRGENALKEAQAQLDAAVAAGMLPAEQAVAKQRELNAQNVALVQNKKEVEQQETTLRANEKELADKEKELETGRQELEENEQKYQDAIEELAKNETEVKEKEQELADAQKKIDDANVKLSDAQKELDDKIEELSDRKVYVLDRDTNIGYVSFENDSSIVEAIANVFPIFFFLVAALVCMTTMTRMVEEQRTQIGVLKALGYGRFRIMNKYLFYSTSAAFLGSIIGFFAGCYIFPQVIWKAYGIMYDFSAEIDYVFNPYLAGSLLVVALLCTGGATYLSCYVEMASVPATLIRPKAPKDGKRILLERIPLIWNRLKFMQKVSIRNTFRYKKRFFMMLLGISGCTALLVTGFGINDSISDIVGMQYEQIEKYDASINLDQELTPAEKEQLKQDTGEYVKEYCFLDSADIEVIKGDVTKSVTMIVPQDSSNFASFVDLHDEAGEAIPFPGKNEVVLNDKTASKLKVSIGDTVMLQDSDFHRLEMTVSGISENYIYNYAYLSAETCRDFITEDPEFRTAYVLYQEGYTDETASSHLLDAEHVSSISGNSVMVQRFGNMIQSLNAIVLLVILCAGALAFIVLYNLTNINITERMREIATIKVLGFYQSEVSRYVLRENLVLTAFGAIVGLFLGKALHAFVILQIDINLVRFPILVEPLSFVFSLALTFVFTMIVNMLFMGGKLRAVDMAESLKAIE